MQAQDLEKITGEFSECLTAAYADIGTGVTFLASHADDPGREALDRMCAQAAVDLGLQDKPGLGVQSSDVAVKSTEDAVYVFLRLPDEPTEALLFKCAPRIDLQSFLTRAQEMIGGQP